MSAGAGTVVVDPTVAVHLGLGAAHTAVIAAAGVVAAAAVAVGAGAGMTWLVTRSVQAGARGAGRAADACEAAVREARRWSGLVGEVAERNARIGVLAAACREEGVATAGLPLMLAFDRQDMRSVREWCAQADRALQQLDRRLASRRRQGLLARLEEHLRQDRERGHRPPAARPAATLATPPRTDPTGSTGPAGPAPAGPRPPALAQAVLAQVQTALADEELRHASAPERARLAEAGAAAVRAAERAAGGSADPHLQVQAYLDSLRAVTQDVLDAVRQRREQAREAAVLVQPLLPTGPGAGPGAAVREELLDVLAGRRELDGDLRSRALRAVDDLVAQVVREHLDATLAAELSALGGDRTAAPVAGMVAGADGTVTVPVPGRAGHELRLALRPAESAPGRSRLTWTTVRASDLDGADADDMVAADESACTAASAVVDRLTGRLAQRGVEHTAQRRDPPGGEVPVDPRLEESRRRAAEERRRGQRGQERRRDAPP